MKYVIAIVLLLAPIVAHAQSEAEKLYVQGQQAYDAARYDDALAAWEKSYALSKLPALLFNIAQAQRLRHNPGDCTKATANYRKFISLSPKATERPTAEGFIAELAPCTEAESKPIVEPFPSPSPTPSSAPAPSPMPVTVTQVDSNAGAGKRLVGYVVGGTGIALVVTGVYFGAKARRLGNEVSDECADGCDWNLVKGKDAEGKRAETTHYVLYGVGVAAIAAGGVLWWMGNKERSASTVGLAPTHGGAAVTWVGHW